MSTQLRDKQQKRIMALAASAVVFGLYAIHILAANAFADGEFTLEKIGSHEFYLLSTYTLIICGIVVITIRSFQDNRVARHYDYHDQLTGLANKANLLFKLRKSFRQKSSKGALILINIRRLSSVNNAYGRKAGDEVLQTCAQRLKFLFEAPAHVAAVAPGTFAVCIPGVSSSHAVNGLSDQIDKALKLPITTGFRTFYTEIAMGAVLFCGKADSPEAILRRAELALLEAKGSQTRSPVIFNAGLQDSAEERGTLETELREALEHEQLETYFQPLVDEDGRTLVGFEALARWNHPRRGMISPNCFVPLAQNLNLTESLGRQIMARALQQIRPLGDLKVSVNVTPDHFLQDDYVNQVRKLLEQTGVAASRLELEITESELLSETDLAAKRIEELRKLGVTVALDDFGTGYSGLAYINKLGVDRIKIDSSFVGDIETSEAARSTIRTIIDIANERDFKVTAEGVETAKQFDFLKQFLGLTYQGYMFSPPLHYREVLECELLHRHDALAFKQEFDKPVAENRRESAIPRATAV